jgi:hypothetical protein
MRTLLHCFMSEIVNNSCSVCGLVGTDSVNTEWWRCMLCSRGGDVIYDECGSGKVGGEGRRFI